MVDGNWIKCDQIYHLWCFRNSFQLDARLNDDNYNWVSKDIILSQYYHSKPASVWKWSSFPILRPVSKLKSTLFGFSLCTHLNCHFYNSWFCIHSSSIWQWIHCSYEFDDLQSEVINSSCPARFVPVQTWLFYNQKNGFEPIIIATMFGNPREVVQWCCNYHIWLCKLSICLFCLCFCRDSKWS